MGNGCYGRAAMEQFPRPCSRSIPPRGLRYETMPRPFFYFLAIVLPAGCIGGLFSTIDQLHHGWFGHLQSNNPWYESMTAATTDGFLAVCLFSAEIKRRRREQAGVTSPVRWKERTEVRTAIYAFAIMLLLAVPFSVIKAISRVQSGPFSNITFWHEFEFSSLLAGGIGAALIGYDRRRLHQDLHSYRKIQCVKCGYDLRATPERCPECGTVVSTTAPPPTASSSHLEVHNSNASA